MASVEERLGPKLVQRVGNDVVTTARTVDQLLQSAQHTANMSHALASVHDLAREHLPVVLALRWVHMLVDLLESDLLEVRLGACQALAAVAVSQDGRDAIRTSGGLRPLVLQLSQGAASPVAAAAALALMSCSACDVCKEAIAECNGIPALLGLISGATTLCAKGTRHRLPDGSLPPRTPSDCKAAVHAAGALMNMSGVHSVQARIVEAGAVSVFEDLKRVASPEDTIATRTNFVLTWLAVGGNDLSKPHSPAPAQQPHEEARAPSLASTSAAATPRASMELAKPTPQLLHTKPPAAIAAAAVLAAASSPKGSGSPSSPATPSKASAGSGAAAAAALAVRKPAASPASSSGGSKAASYSHSKAPEPMLAYSRAVAVKPAKPGQAPAAKKPA